MEEQTMAKANRRLGAAAKKRRFETVSARVSQRVRVLLMDDLERHCPTADRQAEALWTLGAMDGLLDALALCATVRFCARENAATLADPVARDLYERIRSGLCDALFAALEPVTGGGEETRRTASPSADEGTGCP